MIQSFELAADELRGIVIDQDTGEVIEHTSLIPIDQATAWLATRPPIAEAQELIRRAQAACAYYRSKHDVRAHNEAVDIQTRAERYVGARLAEMPKNEGARGQLSGRTNTGKPIVSGGNSLLSPEEAPTLADYGISPMQSSRFQRLAAIPDTVFERAICDLQSDPDSILTKAAILAVAEQDTARPMKPKMNQTGDIYVPHGYDACQTPDYAIDPLLPYLPMEWTIWEPACGERMMVEAFYDASRTIIGSDILTGDNFFMCDGPDVWDCLITNPPYSIKYPWLERCYQLGKPFALLLPVETLGAKTAQRLFVEYGLELILLDQRINFKMPNIGWDGSSAQFPVAWFTWGLSIGQQLTFGEARRDRIY